MLVREILFRKPLCFILREFFSHEDLRNIVREMSGLYLTLWILSKVTIITVLMSCQEKRSSHTDKLRRSVTVG